MSVIESQLFEGSLVLNPSSECPDHGISWRTLGNIMKLSSAKDDDVYSEVTGHQTVFCWL